MTPRVPGCRTPSVPSRYGRRAFRRRAPGRWLRHGPGRRRSLGRAASGSSPRASPRAGAGRPRAEPADEETREAPTRTGASPARAQTAERAGCGRWSPKPRPGSPRRRRGRRRRRAARRSARTSSPRRRRRRVQGSLHGPRAVQHTQHDERSSGRDRGHVGAAQALTSFRRSRPRRARAGPRSGRVDRTGTPAQTARASTSRDPDGLSSALGSSGRVDSPPVEQVRLRRQAQGQETASVRRAAGP